MGDNGGKWGKTGQRLGIHRGWGGMKGLYAVHGSPFIVLHLFSHRPCAPIQRGALHSSEGCPRPTEGVGISFSNMFAQFSPSLNIFPIPPVFPVPPTPTPPIPPFPLFPPISPHFPPFPLFSHFSWGTLSGRLSPALSGISGLCDVCRLLPLYNAIRYAFKCIAGRCAESLGTSLCSNP